VAEDSYETHAARHLEKSAVVSNGPDCQKVEALLGIGYALLAINDRLTDGNALASDLTDEIHAVADQVGDLAVPADRLADAAEAFVDDAVSSVPFTAAFLDGSVPAPGKSAVMARHMHRFLREHPGAEVRAYNSLQDVWDDLRAGKPTHVLAWVPGYLVKGGAGFWDLQDAAAYEAYEPGPQWPGIDLPRDATVTDLAAGVAGMLGYEVRLELAYARHTCLRRLWFRRREPVYYVRRVPTSPRPPAVVRGVGGHSA
jgi:hypothetical protein